MYTGGCFSIQNTDPWAVGPRGRPLKTLKMLWLPLGAGGAAARSYGMFPHPIPGPGAQKLSTQHNAQVTGPFPGASEETSRVRVQGTWGQMPALCGGGVGMGWRVGRAMHLGVCVQR